MQLVHSAQDREIGRRHRPGQAVDAASADPERLYLLGDREGSCWWSIIALRSADWPCRARLPKNRWPPSARRSWRGASSRPRPARSPRHRLPLSAAILAAVRQKLHRSPCPNSLSQLSPRMVTVSRSPSAAASPTISGDGLSTPAPPQAASRQKLHRAGAWPWPPDRPARRRAQGPCCSTASQPLPGREGLAPRSCSRSRARS